MESSLPVSHQNALLRWQEHDFYTSAVVLGIDMGLEGIGVYLRKGPEVLYEKTLMYRIPQTNALEQRRQFRAARRCRKNRRTRLKRLEKLFRRHGIPWFEGDDDALTRSDPFLLRHRALTKKLAIERGHWNLHQASRPPIAATSISPMKENIRGEMKLPSRRQSNGCGPLLSMKRRRNTCEGNAGFSLNSPVEKPWKNWSSSMKSWKIGLSL